MDTNKTPHFRRKTSRSYYTPEGKENFDPNFLLCTPKSIDSPSVREFDEEILSNTRTVQDKSKKKKNKAQDYKRNITGCCGFSIRCYEFESFGF